MPRSADAAIEPCDAEFNWVEGRDLFTGAIRWVPLDLITADYTVGGAADGPLQATTNGLAAGNHVLEALSHALCEAIERDALALWRLLPEPAQDATALDLTTADAELRAVLLDRFACGRCHSARLRRDLRRPSANRVVPRGCGGPGRRGPA